MTDKKGALKRAPFLFFAIPELIFYDMEIN